MKNSAAARKDDYEEIWSCEACKWKGSISKLKILGQSTWFVCPVCQSSRVDFDSIEDITYE